MMRLCMDPAEVGFFNLVEPTQAALQRRYPAQLSAGGAIYFRLDQAVLRGQIEPRAALALINLEEYASRFEGDPDVALCQAQGDGVQLNVCLMRETYVSPSLRPKTFHVHQRRTIHSERQSFEVLFGADHCTVLTRASTTPVSYYIPDVAEYRYRG